MMLFVMYVSPIKFHRHFMSLFSFSDSWLYLGTIVGRDEVWPAIPRIRITVPVTTVYERHYPNLVEISPHFLLHL